MRVLNRRHFLLAALTLLLLTINVVYWWPPSTEEPKMNRQSTAENFRPEDFMVRAQPLPESPDSTTHRDLFHPKPVVGVAKGNQPLPPQRMEQEATRAELAQLKLVGIVIRANRTQAFLTSGTETYLVTVGDPVGHRFRVEDIGIDNIRLKDTKTNVTGTIPLLGR